MRAYQTWCISSLLMVCSLTLVAPTESNAQAIRFQPQGARAAGQGNAFAAQADDPSAIHFNPAGLVQVHGIQTYVGTTIMGGSVQFKGPTGLESRGDFGGSVATPLPSFFYASANLGALGAARLSSLTIGLGVNSPFGSNLHYPISSPFRTAVTSNALPLIGITPTMAYKINDALAVGVSANIYTFASFLGEGHAEQKQLSTGALGIPAGASLELNGTGTGAGLTASLLYTPVRNKDGKPIISVGLVYRSQTVLPLHGAFLVNGTKLADGSTNLVLPQIVTGGIAVWPIRSQEREWKVELDVEYVGWGLYRQLDIQLANGVMIPQPKHWKNVPVIAVGTEYTWLNPAWLPYWDIAVRSGYTYTGDTVSDRTFNPGTISLTAHTLSLGTGFLCKGAGRFLGLIPCSGESVFWPKAIGLDLAYQEWFYESRTVVGNLDPTVDGMYDANVRLGTFSLRSLF